MTAQTTTSFAELQQKAKAGDSLAQFSLGLYYLPKKIWESKDEWRFINDLYWQRQLGLSDNPIIEDEISTAFELSKLDKDENAELAFKWFEKAAEKGHVESQYATARCYFDGIGVEVDYRKGFDYATRSQQQGFLESNLLLGDCYSQVNGINQDDFKAMECYEKACKKGIKSACKKRRALLFSGEGGIKDFEEAREQVRKTISALGDEHQKWYEFIDTKLPLGQNEDENEEIECFFEWLSNIQKAFNQLEKSSISAINNLEKNDELNKRMQKLVEQFTHTLGNVIFPDTIYRVAERLKSNPDCRKDVLLLNEAYHSEIIIKLQAELLRRRHTNDNPKGFRDLIRSCRRKGESADKTKSIADILDYAASRVTARFLNQHNASLGSIRDKILAQKNVSLDKLRQQFEDDILLNKTLGSVEWINQYLWPFEVVALSPLWQKVCILAESHAEALLFGYFSEVLFNAFKYADHDAEKFLTVCFDETVIDGKTYLSCSWNNPMGNKTTNSLGTGKGLDAILEDLQQLNDTVSETKSLLVSQDDEQFQVTMFFQKDLLIDEISMPTFKRKSKTE